MDYKEVIDRDQAQPHRGWFVCFSDRNSSTTVLAHAYVPHSSLVGHQLYGAANTTSTVDILNAPIPLQADLGKPGRVRIDPR